LNADGTVLWTAPKSDVTNPSNFQSPFKIRFSSMSFSQQKYPSTLLYAPMIDPQWPSTIAASNAGRYSSRNVRASMASSMVNLFDAETYPHTAAARYTLGMATLSFDIPDELKALAESRAAEGGFADVAQFISQLIVVEAAGAPEGLAFDTDRELEALLNSRVDGPFVEADAADFQRMREKLRSELESSEKHP
jgi:hypothetical protein